MIFTRNFQTARLTLLPVTSASDLFEDLFKKADTTGTKITRFQDAISSLEAVQTFLDSKGHSEEATRVASTMNRLAHLHCVSLSSARQSTLEEFFHLNVYIFVF